MKYLLILSSAILFLLLYSYFVVSFGIRTPALQFDALMISAITGIISGFVANGLFRQFEKIERLRAIKEKLKKYEGEYKVYHWNDLTDPDKCGYKVVITLDDKNGILKIHQTGSKNEHELYGDIKMNDLTYSYGEGNYTHPHKTGNPTGRIQVYLIDNGTINVDKFYLNDQGQQPGFEKWQWHKEI